MPCRDYGDNGASQISELLGRNTELAQMLCSMCRLYDDAGEPIPFPKVDKWWQAHKKADRLAEAEKRAEAQVEARKARALAKLTVAERKALGLR